MSVFDKLSANKQTKFWRCRRNDIRSVRVHTSLHKEVIRLPKKEHTHDSEAAKIEAEMYHYN